VVRIVAVLCSLDALQILRRNPKEIAMSIRNMLFAAAFALASVEAALVAGLYAVRWSCALAQSIGSSDIRGISHFSGPFDHSSQACTMV
jgi:hypothetical protein